MTQLICKNLACGYDGKAVIDNLNFQIDEGNYLCILGENGSGKSTLMRTILGLQNPVSGSLEYTGSIKKNEIGYLPQQTVVQKDFPASVWEIVLSGCQCKKGILSFYSKEDRELANYNISLMRIEHLKNKCYRELSGGQQQRVLLARALCATSKMLLLDEPVSGLDPIVTDEMYTLIKELNDKGVTIIMISHDIDAALKYATHILHIGKHVFFGTKEEYLNSDSSYYFQGMRGDKQ